MEMERFTGNGSPFHTNLSNPFSPKPRHPKEPHFTSHLRRPLTATKDHHLRRLSKDKELSIFDAERYFKEGRDQTEDCRRKNLLWRGQPATLLNPSGGSVTTYAKTSPVNKQRRGPSACRWPLVGSCPCFSKKAIDVEEKYCVPRSENRLDFNGIGSVSLNKKETKAAAEEICVSVATAGGDSGRAPMEHEMGLEVEEMLNLRLVAESWMHVQDPFVISSDRLRHEGFHFSPFSDGRQIVATAPSRIPAPTSANPPGDPTRDSLDAFHPEEEASATPRETAELIRRATRLPLPGDVTPWRSSNFPASPMARVAWVEDELASDSSSDLFEIESFSTQATPSRPACPGRSSLGEAPATPRATKTPAVSSSSWGTMSPRQPRPVGGSAPVGDGQWSGQCEEGRAGPGQQQNQGARTTATLARSHGSACHASVAGPHGGRGDVTDLCRLQPATLKFCYP